MPARTIGLICELVWMQLDEEPNMTGSTSAPRPQPMRVMHD